MTDDCLTLQRRGSWTEDELLLRCDFPIAPRNCYSNAAYLAVAAWLWEAMHTPEVAAFALPLATLAAGSFAYHGWKKKAANKLDHFGMYAAFIALAVYALAGPSRWTPALMLALAIPGAFLTYRSRRDLNIPMALTLGMASLLAFTVGSPLLGAVSLGLFVLSFLSWLVDRRRWWKRSRLLFPFRLWYHAFWHVGTAAAIGVMFRAVTR